MAACRPSVRSNVLQTRGLECGGNLLLVRSGVRVDHDRAAVGNRVVEVLDFIVGHRETVEIMLRLAFLREERLESRVRSGDAGDGGASRVGQDAGASGHVVGKPGNGFGLAENLNEVQRRSFRIVAVTREDFDFA